MGAQFAHPGGATGRQMATGPEEEARALGPPQHGRQPEVAPASWASLFHQTLQKQGGLAGLEDTDRAAFKNE